MSRPVSDRPRHPLIPPREVDPRQELPALELEVLERWRERDVFARVAAPARGRASSGSSTRDRRRPTARRAPTTCSRACSRTSTRAFRRCAATASSARAAGTATACRWRSRWNRSSASTTRRRSRSTGSREFNAALPRVGVRVPGGVEPADRADRLLDRPRRTPTARSTRATSSRSGGRWREIDERGLLYEGHKVVPYCPRCETTLSSHEVALGYQDVVDPSVFLKLPVLGRRGAAARVDDDAVDAAGQRRGGGRRRRPPTCGCGSGMTIFVLAEARVGAGAR